MDPIGNVPVFIVLLNFAGIISAQAIIKSWRVAILVIVLFTAIATPSLSFGYCAASCWPIVATSAFAWSSGTPALTGPTTVRYHAPRCLTVKFSEYSIGSQSTRSTG